MALQVGDILEGKVTGIKPFGAFIALPENKTGLVHISEVSYEFVQDLSTVLSEGQTVSVKVLNIAPWTSSAAPRSSSACLAAQTVPAQGRDEL